MTKTAAIAAKDFSSMWLPGEWPSVQLPVVAAHHLPRPIRLEEEGNVCVCEGESKSHV